MNTLELEHVSYIYNAGTAYEKKAVVDANLRFEKDTFTGIIGHTGSGKSTLLQMMNGLLAPTEGTVRMDGVDVHEKDFPIRELRRSVGLVFQYPEYQLFEETVLKDVCFGPKNLGCTPEECEERAKYSLSLVGIPESLYTASPFTLSGGQKRRVAIAGVLAMKPDILILDEPTAGLDPEGREQILDMLEQLRQQDDIGIVMVSHSMEDVALYAERVIVMDGGRVLLADKTEKVFEEDEKLVAAGLEIPFTMRIRRALRAQGIDLPVCLKVDQLAEVLASRQKGGRL